MGRTNFPSLHPRSRLTRSSYLASRCCHRPCRPWLPAANPPMCPPSPMAHRILSAQLCQGSSRLDPPYFHTSTGTCLQTKWRTSHGGAFSRTVASVTPRPSLLIASLCNVPWFWAIQTSPSIRLRSLLSFTPSLPWRLLGGAGGAAAQTASRRVTTTNQARRSSTSATSRDAGRFTARRLT